jgi:hypothetical protein
MNCHKNVNSILPTQLPHTFSYIVAILIHNHFESPNILEQTQLNYNIARSNEILGWEGVGNRQLLCFFKA